MAKDLDQLSKQLEKIAKELNDNDKIYSKEIVGLVYTNTKLTKEISDLKKDVKNIGIKIDLILQILNNFTLLLSEDHQDNIINNDESWIPEQEEDWNSYDDDDEEYDQ